MEINNEISSKTCLINSNGKKNCTILEGSERININMSIMDYINYNCEYYGSSFTGRLSSSKANLGMKYKLPIIIEESREIIFFPTKAYDNEENMWISLNNIKKYEPEDNNTIVTFSSGNKTIIDMSYGAFENQVLRATRLLMTLKKRKKENVS